MHPFTTTSKEAVAALGEQRLIAAIRRWLGPASPKTPFGIGDDCAVVHASPRRQLVTVDPVIYGAHFDDHVPSRAVGAKLLKRNLSDIAAMGGRPRAAVIALALDARVKTAWLEGFYRGLASTARRYGVAIVGGDVAQHPGGIVGTLTLIGEAGGPRVITRTGARVGDWIYVTGVLGGSLPSGHHWRFTPRLAEGAWLAQARGVRAMMDLSDGLAKDLHDLTPPGAEPALEADAVPRRRGFDLRAALSDGEDYELLFALDARSDRVRFERAWARRFATPLACIGRFVRPENRPAGALDLKPFHGFEHLR
ncbi:MAG TPA: thiamine-phosphate kinase [Opitutaceae bacterium]